MLRESPVPLTSQPLGRAGQEPPGLNPDRERRNVRVQDTTVLETLMAQTQIIVTPRVVLSGFNTPAEIPDGLEEPSWWAYYLVKENA